MAPARLAHAPPPLPRRRAEENRPSLPALLELPSPRRILFSVVCSLVAAALVLVTWLSFVGTPNVDLLGRIGAIAGRGRFMIYVGTVESAEPYFPAISSEPTDSFEANLRGNERVIKEFSAVGIRYYVADFVGGVRYRRLTFPLWFPVLLFFVPPFHCWLRVRRSRRRREWLARGHCPQCGYDLRFTGSACGECGLPINWSRGDAAHSG